jgi:DNA-binding beta-propeller fold protein YncE
MRGKVSGAPLGALLVAVALAGCAPSAASGNGPYSVVETIPLGGSGHWDYVSHDAAGHRLYVSHNTHVEVVDADTHKRIGSVEVAGFAHGTAVDHEHNRGFITVGTSSFAHGADAHEVVAFDLQTLQVVRHIDMPKDPDGIRFEPTSKRIVAFTGESHSAVVIDPATEQIVKTVALPSTPGSSVADSRGHLFVTLEDPADVLDFDTSSFALARRLHVPGCRKAVGVAVSTATDRLFVACRNRTLAVMNLHDGTLVASVAIARHNDAAAFDPVTRTLFVSTLDGTLSIVRDEGGDHYRLVENLPTFPGSRTLALDPATHRVYMSYAKLAPLPLGAMRYPDPIDGTFAVLVIAENPR